MIGSNSNCFWPATEMGQEEGRPQHADRYRVPSKRFRSLSEPPHTVSVSLNGSIRTAGCRPVKRGLHEDYFKKAAHKAS